MSRAKPELKVWFTQITITASELTKMVQIQYVFVLLPVKSAITWLYSTDCWYRCVHCYLNDKVKMRKTQATQAIIQGGCIPCFITVLTSLLRMWINYKETKKGKIWQIGHTKQLITDLIPYVKIQTRRANHFWIQAPMVTWMLLITTGYDHKQPQLHNTRYHCCYSKYK